MEYDRGGRRTAKGRSLVIRAEQPLENCEVAVYAHLLRATAKRRRQKAENGGGASDSDSDSEISGQHHSKQTLGGQIANATSPSATANRWVLGESGSPTWELANGAHACPSLRSSPNTTNAATPTSFEFKYSWYCSSDVSNIRCFYHGCARLHGTREPRLARFKTTACGSEVCVCSAQCLRGAWEELKARLAFAIPGEEGEEGKGGDSGASLSTSSSAASAAAARANNEESEDVLKHGFWFAESAKCAGGVGGDDKGGTGVRTTLAPAASAGSAGSGAAASLSPRASSRGSSALASSAVSAATSSAASGFNSAQFQGSPYKAAKSGSSSSSSGKKALRNGKTGNLSMAGRCLLRVCPRCLVVRVAWP